VSIDVETAGLDPAVKHRALGDALAVVRLLRVGILGRAA
jgi:DNA polymerase III epsilon subunit-like protein